MTLMVHNTRTAHTAARGPLGHGELPRLTHTVSVAVLAQDRLTGSLVTLALRRLGPVAVVEPGHGEADVVLVVVDELDDEMLARMAAPPPTAGAAPRPVLLLCRRIDEYQLMSAIDHGVRSVLDWPSASLERLVQCIVDVHTGSAEMPGEALRALVARMGAMRSAGAARSRVSERELSVIKLVADGLGNAEIAQRLAFSERTVKNIVAAVSGRFEVANRAHLVAFAFRNTLL